MKLGNNNENDKNAVKKIRKLGKKVTGKAKGLISRKLAERKQRKAHEKLLKAEAKAIEEEAFREARRVAERERAVKRGIERGKRARMTKAEKVMEAGRFVETKAKRAIRFAHKVGVAGSGIHVDIWGDYGKRTVAPARKRKVRKPVKPTPIIQPNIAATILGGFGETKTKGTRKTQVRSPQITPMRFQGMHETLGLNEFLQQRKKRK